MDRNTALTNVSRASNRYTQGGIVDIYNTRVGWWERTVFPKHETDIIFYVDNNNERRPDLIAYDVYKNAKYAWIVLQYNNIVDVNEELVNGARLLLPTPNRLNNTVLSNTTGGKRIEENVETN